MSETIRPEVQALIIRGAVNMDEIPHGCNLMEASALVPALTNAALGLRINRVLAKHPVLPVEGEDPILSPHALYAMADEAARRIQAQPPVMWPHLSDSDLGCRIVEAVEFLGGRPQISETYEQALRLLADEASTRLFERFAKSVRETGK